MLNTFIVYKVSFLNLENERVDCYNRVTVRNFISKTYSVLKKIENGKKKTKNTETGIIFYNSSLGSSSRSTSDKSISSAAGNSPSLPSQGSVDRISGSAAPLTGAVVPRP